MGAATRRGIDRRQLLGGAAALGGLVVAFHLWPRADRSPLARREGEAVLGPYLRIADDGEITLALPQAETGQGIWTALARVAAVELGVEAEAIGVIPAPLAPDFVNPATADLPMGPLRLTALASSIRGFEPKVRAAAATARARLLAEGAERMEAAPADCRVERGRVVCGTNAIGFGALAEGASRRSDVAAPAAPQIPVPPTAPSAPTDSAGPRLDGPAKANGTWRLAADIRLPDMLFASIRMPPPGGRMLGWSKSAAAPDIRIVAQDDWLAAIGPTWWAAEQALVRARPRWRGPSDADTPTIEAALVAALDRRADRTIEEGDYALATRDRRPLAATYAVAPQPHLSLEPPAAVARWIGGTLELWAPGLAADLVRARVARELGIAETAIRFFPVGAGDGQGRALEAEAAGQAAILAREAGRPVALTWPANVGQHLDPLRPPLAIRLSALHAEGEGLASWHARVAGCGGLDAALARMGSIKPPGIDPADVAIPYRPGASLTAVIDTALPIRTGYHRGDVAAAAVFATESFIDEMARAKSVDPLTFRLTMLGHDPRLAAVLMQAAQVAGWDGGAIGSSRMGLACASLFGSRIALVAEAGVAANQRVAASRLVAVADIGRAASPSLARAEIEANLVSALTAATGPAVEIVAGVARARPLSTLGLTGLSGLPQIEVRLVEGGGDPGGVSGLADAVLAPALANAVQAASAKRLRRLPLDPMDAA